jgi:hypothetical protein
VKKLFLLFLFLAAAIPNSAQTIKWSQPLEDDNKIRYMKILGSDEEGFFILRSNFSFNTDRDHGLFSSRKYELQYYSDNLSLKWASSNLVAPEKGKTICDVALAGSRVVVLTSRFDKYKKQLILKAEKFSQNGKDTASVVLKTLNVLKVDEDNKPDLIVSHDQHLLACALRLMPKDKEEQLYEVTVFDTNLAILYSRQISVPISYKRYNPLNSILSDEGNFFILGMEFTTDKRVKAPGQSFYKIFSYNKNKDAVTTNEIKIENKYLTDVALNADNLNHKIVVAGFYSDRTTYSVAGVFYYSLNEDSLASGGGALMQTPAVSTAFTPDFLRRFAAEKNPQSKELMNYSIDRIVIRKDGGAALVAESFYTTTRSYWDYYRQMWMTHYYYHFGNVMALSINPDGSLLWSNVISKDQNSTDDNGYLSSYFSAIISGKIFCFYNKYVNDPGSVLRTTVSGKGEQDTQILFTDNKNISIIPRSSKQVDESTVLVPVYKENKTYLVKIEFE